MERSIHEEDRRLLGRELTGPVVACAFRVHASLGPGLLESAYRRCLLHELHLNDIHAVQEQPIPLSYRGCELDCGYRADIVVEHSVLIEVKAVERLLPVHVSQVLTYLKLAKLRVGLLMNFNTFNLRNGIRRLVR